MIRYSTIQWYGTTHSDTIRFYTIQYDTIYRYDTMIQYLDIKRYSCMAQMLSFTLNPCAVTEPDRKKYAYWIFRSTIMRLLSHVHACLSPTQCVSRLSQPGLVVVPSEFTASMHSSMLACPCRASQLVDSWSSGRHRHPGLASNMKLRDVWLASAQTWSRCWKNRQTARKEQSLFCFTIARLLFSSHLRDKM